MSSPLFEKQTMTSGFSLTKKLLPSLAKRLIRVTLRCSVRRDDALHADYQRTAIHSVQCRDSMFECIVRADVCDTAAVPVGLALALAVWLHLLKHVTFVLHLAAAVCRSGRWLRRSVDISLGNPPGCSAGPVHGSGLAPYKRADLKSTIMRHRLKEKACLFPFL